jgi:hypothetical protein
MKFLITIILSCLGFAAFSQIDSTSTEVIPAYIRMFPNPAVNDMYITIRQEGISVKKVTVFDQQGNKVLEKKVVSTLGTPIKLSVTELKQGKYFVLLETNKQPLRLQLLKN